ncbi:MAG: hypothetical protein V2J51_10420, partial [Erythrobacter sp.]|nr:hypothetical protein [Erythrobacter sp.]
MGDESVWEVDRIAASELLAFLANSPQADWGILAAKAFSKMRLQSYEWAAERVHQSAIKALKTEAAEIFQHQEPEWTDGYRHAEECLLATSPAELLEVNTRASKGQVLRSFIRTAKRR